MEEKNMMVDLMNQLNISKTFLRALLSLAIEHNETLVPLVQNTIEINESKIEMAMELIDRNHNNRKKKG